MNTPPPSVPPSGVAPTYNPTAAAVGAGTAGAVLVGYGATVLAQKYGIPTEVVSAALTGLTTILVSLWHRLMPRAPDAST
jgi:hypothetical protein